MEKTLKFANSSELYRKINAMNLSPTQRRDARAALVRAEKVTDLVAGLLRLFGLRSQRPA